MANTREENVYMAKLAEQSERYEDMVEFMKNVVKANESLTVEERNLLSVAYKNIIGSRRASWRIITSLDSKVANSTSEEKDMKSKMISLYKDKIEAELAEKCKDVLALLDGVLAEVDDLDTESKVFYLKMKGDYHRYLAEFTKEDKKDDARNASLEAYEKATDAATEKLPAIHPVRLGLALNFSVFHYEIMNSPEVACDLAKKAFEDAVEDMEKTPDSVFKDSQLIMQLLRDNLTLWTSESEDVENEDDDEEAN